MQAEASGSYGGKDYGKKYGGKKNGGTNGGDEDEDEVRKCNKCGTAQHSTAQHSTAECCVHKAQLNTAHCARSRRVCAHMTSATFYLHETSSSDPPSLASCCCFHLADDVARAMPNRPPAHLPAWLLACLPASACRTWTAKEATTAAAMVTRR
jgi:hypothetical protein